MKKLTFFIGIFICFILPISAQSVEDSLYKVALISVYDNPDKAIKIAKELIKTYHKDNPEKQIQDLLLLCNAYSSKREYESSIKYAQQAHELNQTLKNNLLEIQILNKIAAQYHELGVNDKALEYLDQAEILTENFEHQDSIANIIGINYAIRGFIYRDQLNCDIAIEYLQKAYTTITAQKPSTGSLVNRSVTMYNLGNCYLTLNQYEQAKIHFNKAYELAVESKANSLKAFSKKGLAEVYTSQGNYQESISELNQAIQTSKNVGDLVLNRGIYKGMADNYLALKDWSNYQDYKNLYDSVVKQIKASERNTINLAIIQNSDATSEEIQTIKRNYSILIFIVGIALLSILISIFLGQKSFSKRFRKLKSKIKY